MEVSVGDVEACERDIEKYVCVCEKERCVLCWLPGQCYLR